MPASSSKSKVYFFNEFGKFRLTDRRKLKSFIEDIFKKHGRKLSFINYVFVNDNKLLEINKRFLNHNFLTDIITFELSTGSPVEAEVYISIDRVRENSKDLKLSFNSELHRVIFHGVLHLCGFSDKTKKGEVLMRKNENLLINRYL